VNGSYAVVVTIKRPCSMQYSQHV